MTRARNMRNILEGLSKLEYHTFEKIANELPDLVVDRETEQILIDKGLIIVNEVLQHFNDNKPPKLIKNYVVPGPVEFEWALHVAEGR
jgi:hypothetical protein